MHVINSLRDAARVTHYHIAEKIGWERCKVVKKQIAWRLEQNGWISPQRVFVSEYDKDIYRFSSCSEKPIIKSVWPFDVLQVDSFEITIHSSELNKEFAHTLMDFVAACYDHRSKDFDWPMFNSDKAFPGYAWSEKAYEVKNKGRK